MKSALVIYTIVALLSGLVACSTAESDVSPTAVRNALTPDLIVTEKEHFVKGDERLVVVVGENHASVKTQIQLANLTTRLLDQNLVQAILVEGSSGPFDISPFIRDLQRLPMSSTDLAAFWRQQLEAGRVAGYEYVALTRPGVEIVGVEDMGAKARYEVGFQTRAYREVAASYDRAAEVLEQEFDSLREKSKTDDVQRVRSSVDEFKSARERFARVPADVAEKLEPLGPPQVEMMELQSLFLPLYQRLNSSTPSLSDYSEWAQSLEESDLTSNQRRDLEIRMSTFERLHRQDLEQLENAGPKFLKLSKEMDEAQKKLEPFFEQVEALTADLEDSFFLAANELRSLAAGVRAPRPKVMAFFSEENERERKDSDSNEQSFLAERDRALVARTEQYLRSQTKQRVLLIVGYAHVVGITETLTANNISFISGRLQASDEDIEPWEGEAWEFRKRANVPIFSALEPQLKELSPLLSDIWKREQLARLDYLRRTYQRDSGLEPTISGLAGNSRIFEKVGNEDRVLVIGRLLLDRNADFGTHVFDYGPVPGKAGEFYTVFDRSTAGDLIKELSDETVDFVYHYKTATSPGGTATYRLKTAAGEKSLADFMESPPSTAKYVVLFGEPDEVEEAGLFVSPLQSQLRGGGTPPPGGRVPWTSAFADPGDPHRPILLRTINSQRAHQNLVALEKQQLSRLGDVAFFEDTDLPALSEKLLFTPSRGDHAHMVVLTAKNTAEFRARIRKAADTKLLKGKQVALITCGDAFVDTAALREDLLRTGVLMVWVNDRQITPEAARRLCDEVKKTVKTLPAEQRKTIEQLMDRSLQNWRKADPRDPGHDAFRRAGGFVDARPCGHLSLFQS